jgi:hypothetical protein
VKIRPVVCINAVLALPASISLYAGIRNSLARSQDFQWSGADLALHHIDPYRQFLSHDVEHRILFSQVPNYLHELYILMLPLGSLGFSHAKPVWAVLNCLFAVLITHLLRQLYNLPRPETILLLLLLFCSTPFRIALGNGQQTLLELLFFCLIFYFTKPMGQGTALGLSYSKYSFSPVVFLYFFFRRQFRMLAISAVVPLAGLLIMWALVHGNLITLGTEPLVVSHIGVAAGLGDLMTIIQIFFHKIVPEPVVGRLIYAAALLASAGYAFWLSRQKSVSIRRDAAPIAVASLMFFTHLTYDYVFLVIPLAAALATPRGKPKIFLLVAIGLLWFGVKFLQPLGDSQPAQATISVVVFLLLFGVLIALQVTRPTAEDPI